MKIQIKFQKILFLVTLILAAIALVYGFSFCTGALHAAFTLVSGGTGDTNLNPINSDGVYQFVMGKGDYIGNKRWGDGPIGFNDLLVILCVVLVIICALQFFFATNSRRNYYLTNYISVGVLVVYALVVAAVAFWGISHTQALFNQIDFATYKTLYDNGSSRYYSDSHVIFALGYAVFALVLVDAILLVLNTVWKYLLMKGEKELLSKNTTLTEEVA